MAMIASHLPPQVTRVGELYTRERFEEAVANLVPPFPLGAITINGAFERYFDPQTQAAWEGWQKAFMVAAKYQGRLWQASTLALKCATRLREGWPRSEEPHV